MHVLTSNVCSAPPRTLIVTSITWSGYLPEFILKNAHFQYARTPLKQLNYKALFTIGGSFNQPDRLKRETGPIG